MRRFGFLLIYLAVAFPVLAEDWTTADGKVYKNVVVVAQEDDGVRITYDGGVGKIPYYELSLDLQKRFGEDYDTLMSKRSEAEKALDDATRKADAAAAKQKELDDAAAAAAAAAAQQNNAQSNPSSGDAAQSGGNGGSGSTAMPGGSTPSGSESSAPSGGTAQSGSAAQPGRPGQPKGAPTPGATAQAKPGSPAGPHSAGVAKPGAPGAAQPDGYVNLFPGSSLNYDEVQDVCYLDSPTVDVELIVLDASQAPPAGQSATLKLRTITEGRKPETPDRVEGTFYSGPGEAHKIPKNPKIKFLVDGTYIAANEPTPDDAAPSSDTNLVIFYLAPEKVKAIFLGQKVNFSVGPNEYRINDEALDTFRKYVEDVQHLPPASTDVVRAYHRFIARLPSIVTLISTVCEYIILGSFTILLAASIAAFIMGLTRFIKM